MKNGVRRITTNSRRSCKLMATLEPTIGGAFVRSGINNLQRARDQKRNLRVELSVMKWDVRRVIAKCKGATIANYVDGAVAVSGYRELPEKSTRLLTTTSCSNKFEVYGIQILYIIHIFSL